MEDYVSRTQEQATAAWTQQLIQARMDRLIEAVKARDISYENALAEIQKLKVEIAELICSNRGGEKGIHGFIAEAAEVRFENAEAFIRGLKASASWVNNNDRAVDIRQGDVDVQLKFVQKNFGIGYSGTDTTKASGFYATLKNNPDFLKNGGKLMTSKDNYDKILRLCKMSQEEASRLPNNAPDGMTYAAWKAIQEFFSSTGATMDDIEPSLLTYAEVQKNAIEETIQKKEEELQETDAELREKAIAENQPTVQEGAKVAAVSAALEGGTAFVSGVIRKRKAGKKLTDFTVDDWKELGVDTASGTIKGGIRGAAVYTISNFTATPANVATSLVTATFGVTAQARLLREGTIDREEFLISSEALCLDVSISTVSAMLGQTLIPVPVLGAIIGNTAGMFLYDIAKQQGLTKEQKLIETWQAEISHLDEALEKQYQLLRRILEQNFKKFQNLMEFAFDLDVNRAFEASIDFARFNGVAEEKILKSKADIDRYFLA